MDIKEILQKYWGHKEFRPLQEDIIQSVLEGNDTLALLPTGGGKSICFQVPAMAKQGICIVVSPLIALMKDQVENLKKKNIKAAAIYSGMSYREIDITLDNCIYDDVKFLYVSPERLKTELFLTRFKKMKPCLIAVDEAHCISQWGYDFRPPYLEIANIREYFPNVPILALTATATPDVVVDIQEKLNFKKDNVFQKSFARSNLAYVVIHTEDKQNRMLNIFSKVKGTAVVYVRNRKKTEEIARFLQSQGISADFYHAGLDGKTRDYKQERWMKGLVRVIVCTNAFGMGIDKPDVRLVIHLDLPDSLEAYFQEAGRAGRDGKNSYAVMLYNQSDIMNLEKTISDSFPSIDDIRTTYQSLANYLQIALGAGENMSYEIDIADLCEKYRLNRNVVLNSMRFLIKDGYFSVSESLARPSRVKIEASKEAIYKFYVFHSEYEPLLKYILRNCPGVFTDFVRIDETEIAIRLKSEREKIINQLNELTTQDLITYLPSNKLPLITFDTPRLDRDEIGISRENYQDRMNIAIRKAKAVINYVTDKKCRSQLLLEYFGETNSQRCGHCDYCISRNKAELSQLEFDNIVAQIKPLLKENQLSVSELIKKLTGISEDKAMKAIRWLMDNGKIISDKEGNLTWKS